MSDVRVAWETAKKKAGIDDYILMEIMGHSDHRMMRRYAHLTPEHKRKAVNSLPAWQKSVTNSGEDENCIRAITPQPIELTGTYGRE